MSIWRDPNGKPSMARTVAFMLACSAVAISGAVTFIIAVGKSGAEALKYVAEILAALVGGGTVALLNRVRDRNGNG